MSMERNYAIRIKVYNTEKSGKFATIYLGDKSPIKNGLKDPSRKPRYFSVEREDINNSLLLTESINKSIRMPDGAKKLFCKLSGYSISFSRKEDVELLEEFAGEYDRDAIFRDARADKAWRIHAKCKHGYTNVYARKAGENKPAEEPGPDIFEKCLKGEVKENNVVEEKKDPDDRIVHTSFGLYTEAMFNGKFIRPLERKIDELDAEIARLQTLKVKYKNAIDVINELFKDEVVKP